MKTLKQILKENNYLSINLTDKDGMNAIIRADLGFKKIIREWLQQKLDGVTARNPTEDRDSYSLLTKLLEELEQ